MMTLYMIVGSALVVATILLLPSVIIVAYRDERARRNRIIANIKARGSKTIRINDGIKK